MKKIILTMVMLASALLKAETPVWHLETIMGYTIDRNGIVFQVYDGGCTRSEDFNVQVQRMDSNDSLVTLFRKKADYCKAFFPYGRLVRFNYDALGINRNESFVIANPINPGFVRY